MFLAFLTKAYKDKNLNAYTRNVEKKSLLHENVTKPCVTKETSYNIRMGIISQRLPYQL